MQAEEVSASLGKTTKLSVSDSLSRDHNGMLRRSISRRNEERPLMTTDELKKLDRDKVILIPERQNPIIARRIVYYQDPAFRTLIEAQKGPLPYPSREAEDIRALKEQVSQLTSQLSAKPTAQAISYPAPENAAKSELASAEGAATQLPEESLQEQIAETAPESSRPVSGVVISLLDDDEPGLPVLSDEELLESLRPSEQRALETMMRVENKILGKIAQ
ncbi:type IV secretory system conjugative DNA transfer family protein [Paracoccus yeei]|uniref:type IV secretory system conjugative DNA transfer family protein n=1 Tax=Paracoccus yeei TaxID=147645 RepID=UPI00048E74C7|nr:type IV secretory system conjugative DNA transfer family protein [Paracoccus yeei]OWJ95081.1 hypothetical protein CDV54_08735 [Paracoccus yeei]